MIRPGALLLLVMFVLRFGIPAPGDTMSVCELSNDFPAFRNRVVTVRGVYYYGLRQECPQKRANGLWPSFINLDGGNDTTWAALAKSDREVEAEAKRTGKRFEIWVTVVGRLQTVIRQSRQGPCDRKRWALGGYGHLGVFPSEISVESIRDIEVRENPQSPYDYGNMYHGAL